MSWDFYDEMEARAEARNRRRAQQCQCGGDMPGFCPGPAACPMCEQEVEDDEADEAGADD